MAKSKIIKELANNEISLEVALSRLLIIASDIGNEELQKWAESELNGYHSGDKIPDYRISKSLVFRYSGLNGSFMVKNHPMQVDKLLGIPSKNFYLEIMDGIKAIEEILKMPDNSYARDLSWAAGDIYEKTGIQCLSIVQQVPVNEIEGIVNSLRTLLLKIFIKLDKTYGSLDDVDIDTGVVSSDVVRETNSVINNYIYIDNSVTIGDDNTIKSSDIGQ